jgi:hypothetical protein
MITALASVGRQPDGALIDRSGRIPYKRRRRTPNFLGIPAQVNELGHLTGHDLGVE